MLDSEGRKKYANLLREAFDAVRYYDGSSKSFNDIAKPLGGIDNITAQLDPDKKHSRDVLQAEFTRQVVPDLPENEPRNVDDFLNVIIRFYRQMNLGTNYDETLKKLHAGGSAVVKTDNVFIPPQDGTVKSGISDDSDSFEIEFQNRLGTLLEALKNIGIYMNDLIIHIGGVKEAAFRQIPYVLVQIPRLNKEIAICDQKNESPFVCDRILGVALWSNLTKEELKLRPDITPVPFQNPVAWQERVLKILFKDNITKDLGQNKNPHKFVSNNLFDLDYDLIGQSIIETYKEKEKWPISKSKNLIEHGPYKGLLSWNAIEQSLVKGQRGLPGGSSLAKIKEIYGASLGYINFKNQEPLDRELIKQSIRKTVEATGKWPVVNPGGVDGGMIKFGPYAIKETWAGVNAAAAAEARGLSKNDILTILKQECGWEDSKKKPLLEIKKIKACIRETQHQSGEWVTRNSGEIIHGPYSKGEGWKHHENWHAIQVALTKPNPARGLPKGYTLNKLVNEVKSEPKFSGGNGSKDYQP